MKIVLEHHISSSDYKKQEILALFLEDWNERDTDASYLL